MSFVLCFGGPSREAVIKAFRAIVADEFVKTLVLPIEEEETLAYREFSGTLDEALTSLAEGHSGSVQIESQDRTSLLAGVYRPRFAKERLADWSVSAEGESFDAESAFDRVRVFSGLTYVALSRDECVDFDVEHVTEGNFPWSDWKLLAGAVRDAQGNWITRRSA